MKKFSTLLIIAVAIILAVVHSCSKQKNNESSPQTSNINKSTSSYQSNDTLIRFLNDSVGIGYFQNGVPIIDNLDETNFTYVQDNLTYTLSNFEIIGVTSTPYLIASATSGNNHLEIALALILDPANTPNSYSPTNGGTETNTCTGAPCSTCVFTKDTNGKITGCDCSPKAAPSDKCNHTLTSTTGPQIYSQFIFNYSAYPNVASW
ncbi:MAG: hypothetical protein WCO28_11595 [Bacteroidota bacterium]